MTAAERTAAAILRADEELTRALRFIAVNLAAEMVSAEEAEAAEARVTARHQARVEHLERHSQPVADDPAADAALAALRAQIATRRPRR